MKKWIVSNSPVNPENEVVREFGEVLGGILLGRGIVTLDSARSFFSCEALSDPLLMSDMKKAVEIIQCALDEDLKITVFGDYDCDGTAATAILYSYLEAQGADVDFYIPDRSEGFGMNIEALKKLVSRGTELIITVDNGISAVKEAEFLKENGVELIITDHHQPGAQLPPCGACVDPNRADDPSPFQDLCGAGVVLKLLTALEGDGEFVLDSYADLAAVATIGDVVPLKGENRYIVGRGLENIRREQNAGLSQLIASAGRSCAKITSADLAFAVCPRINAAGRVSDASKAVRLMLCEDDADTARRLAEELSELNSERQSLESAILKDVEKQIAENPLIVKQRVIVLSGEGWHHGVIGIVCAKILEKYGKPVIMIGTRGGEARGSVRSIEGFSVHKMLTECGGLLTKFGGHPSAGGFSLPTDKIEEFTARVHEYAKSFYPKMPTAEIAVDREVTARELSIDTVKRLNLLEPFGEGNRAPLFLLKNCTVKSKMPMKDGKFTSFTVESGGVTIRAKSFKIPFGKFSPKAGDRIDLLAAADINEWNGNVSVELGVADYRPSGFFEDRFFAASRVYEEICRGEGCDKKLAPRVIPGSREELKKIYDLVKAGGGVKTAEELALFDNSVNYCMLRITLDAFAEAGMIELTADGVPKIIPNAGKRDLFSAGLLFELKNLFS